jgi:hypothetical protein
MPTAKAPILGETSAADHLDSSRAGEPCTVVLLVEVDPLGLVQDRKGP